MTERNFELLVGEIEHQVDDVEAVLSLEKSSSASQSLTTDSRVPGRVKTARKGRTVQAVEGGRICFGNLKMGLLAAV